MVFSSYFDMCLQYQVNRVKPYLSKPVNSSLSFTHRLESDEIVNIDTSGSTHLVSVLDISMCESSTLSLEENKIIEYVISEFGNKSAFELEGIATLDYVACNLTSKNQNDIDIVKEVKRIKGTKFTNQQLEEYMEVLKKHRYLT